MLTREKISYFRKKRRLTTTQLAKKVGVTEATISRYETGSLKKIPMSKLEKFAEIFECAVEDLIGDEYVYNFPTKVTKGEENKQSELDYDKMRLLDWYDSLTNEQRVFINSAVVNRDIDTSIMIISTKNRTS